MSDPDAAPLTLIGRTSAWQSHLPAGPADRGASAPGPARGARPFLASWVHHRRYGTLGVYLATAGEPAGIVLQRGQWLQLTGVVRPCLAYALPDDPRSSIALAYTPLLIAVTTIRSASSSDRQRPAPLPLLEPPRHVRLLPANRIGPGQLAPLARWADAVYWHATGGVPAVSATWNSVRGVVTKLGAYRYLRYVLSWRSPQI